MTKRRQPGTLPEAIDTAYEQVGGAKRAADLLGVRLSAAYGLSDPDPNAYAPMTLAQANVLSAAGATAFAQHFALACRGAFLPPIDAADGEVGLSASRLGQETGAALAELYAALSDHKVTPAEARDAMPEVRAVIDAATRLFATLQAIAEGGA